MPVLNPLLYQVSDIHGQLPKTPMAIKCGLSFNVPLLVKQPSVADASPCYPKTL